MRTTIYQVLVQNGVIVRKEEMGNCNIDERNMISARVYDKFQKNRTMVPKKNQSVWLMTKEGLFNTDRHPFADIVKFEEKDFEDPYKLKGTPATRAKKKYNSANYDRQEIVFPKGDREKYQKLVKEHGYNSIGDFVKEKLAELENK